MYTINLKKRKKKQQIPYIKYIINSKIKLDTFDTIIQLLNTALRVYSIHLAAALKFLSYVYNLLQHTTISLFSLLISFVFFKTWELFDFFFFFSFLFPNKSSVAFHSFNWHLPAKMIAPFECNSQILFHKVGTKRHSHSLFYSIFGMVRLIQIANTFGVC